MEEVGHSITGFKAKVSAWGKRIGLRGNQNIQKGLNTLMVNLTILYLKIRQRTPFMWSIANRFVLKKVREELGLKECRHMPVGAAPIHRDVLEYFMSVNMPILEVYGMSENTGPHTISVRSEFQWRTGSCGKPIDGVELMLKPDKQGRLEVNHHISG